mgnify:CR=1 FL=1
MRTAKEREEAFRRDLAELLEKHGAELNVTDDGRSYGMQSGVCEVIMGDVWSADGDTLLAEYAEFTIE